MKYPAIHELDERHGLPAILFTTLLRANDNSCMVAWYRAIFSVLMDGSTDKGRVENELFVILFCKRDNALQEIKTCAKHFCILEPTKAAGGMSL